MISYTCATKYPPNSIDYIYALRHPVSMDIFYVGITNKPKNRLKQHCGEINKPASESKNESKCANVTRYLI